MFLIKNTLIMLKLLSKGRIGRVHYFLSTLAIAFFGVTLALLLSVIPVVGGVLASIYVVGVIGINIMFTAQRCHDINLSAWYSLLSLIPLASIYFYLAPGTQTYNLYGRQPSPCCQEAKFATFAVSMLFMVGTIVAVIIYSYPVMTNAVEASRLIVNR